MNTPEENQTKEKKTLKSELTVSIQVEKCAHAHIPLTLMVDTNLFCRWRVNIHPNGCRQSLKQIVELE
jgi:hypothetical protein